MFNIPPLALSGVRVAGIDGVLLVLTVAIAVAVRLSLTAERVGKPVPARPGPRDIDHGTPAATPAPSATFSVRNLQLSARLAGATRIEVLTLLLIGLALVNLGMRRLAGSGSLSLGLVVIGLGLAPIVLLSGLVASRTGSRRSLEETPAEKAQAGPLTWLRAGGTARQLFVAATAISAALVWLAMRSRLEDESHRDIVVLWLVSMGALVLAVAWPIRLPDRATIRRRLRQNWIEWAIGLALVLAAFAIRAWRLESYPNTFSGDEGLFANEAVSALLGRIGDPFGTGIQAHPNFYFFLQAGSMRVFGQTVIGIRMLSALLGVCSVLITFVYARRMFGRLEAVVAAMLLASFHFHVFISRIAMNNVGDTLFSPLTLWLVDRGIFGRRRVSSLLTGFAIGLSQLFYVGARLIPIVAVAVVVVGLIDDEARRQSTLVARARAAFPFFLLMTIGAVVSALPFLIYYARYPDVAGARINQVSAFASGWLTREEVASGQSASAILLDKLRISFLIPFHSDISGFYRPVAPFVGLPLAVPIIIGFAIVLRFCTRHRYAPLAVAYLAAVISITLTEGRIPQSNRFSVMAPLLCLFAAIGIGQVARIAHSLLRVPGAVVSLATLATTALLCIWSLHFYFRYPNPVALYSDPNTEVAASMAYEFRSIGPGLTVYFSGAPRMFYDGFANIAFIAPEATGIDIEQPWTAASERPQLTGETLFVFLPDRRGELDQIRQWFPDGTVQEFTTADGGALFTEYRVSSMPLEEIEDG